MTRAGRGVGRRRAGWTLIVALGALAGAPAAGQEQALRVVMRSELVEVQADDAVPSPEAGPMAAMAPMMKQMLMPEGFVEVVTLTSGEALRMEYRHALAMFPKGSVVLRPSGAGEMFVLDPSTRTYFRAPVGSAGRMGPLAGPGAEPQVTVTPTGETEVIAGHRAERATVEIAVSGAGGPPGLPDRMTVSGDIWYADGLLTEAEARVAEGLLQAIPMMGGAGAQTIAKPGRVVLRSRARMSMMAGYEFRTEVTAVGRVSADAGLFAVPADYTEVPMPMPRMPGP